MMEHSPPGIDPIIQGLLVRLPKSGDVWPSLNASFAFNSSQIASI
jgi:hypothetical protein